MEETNKYSASCKQRDADAGNLWDEGELSLHLSGEMGDTYFYLLGCFFNGWYSKENATGVLQGFTKQ